MSRLGIYLWLVIAFLLLGLALTQCGTASAHPWYDFSCCNEGDCLPTALGEVQRRDNGWYVVPTRELRT